MKPYRGDLERPMKKIADKTDRHSTINIMFQFKNTKIDVVYLGNSFRYEDQYMYESDPKYLKNFIEHFNVYEDALETSRDYGRKTIWVRYFQGTDDCWYRQVLDKELKEIA